MTYAVYKIVFVYDAALQNVRLRLSREKSLEAKRRTARMVLLAKKPTLGDARAVARTGVGPLSIPGYLATKVQMSGCRLNVGSALYRCPLPGRLHKLRATPATSTSFLS